MRRTDYLISTIRGLSRNKKNPGGDVAISDEEILQALNDAQDRMQNLLCANKNSAKIFSTQRIIPLVANQESYSVTDRVLLNKQLDSVEFSASGLLSDYVKLDKLNVINRDTNTSNYLIGYSKRGNQILVQPTPSVGSGSLRVQYEREVDDLDVRRGKVSTVNGLTSTGFTSLVLDSSADAYEDTTLPINWSNIDYVCVVDGDGKRKAFNIPVSSYNTGSNTLTPGTFTFSTDVSETIVAGDYCLFGKYKTTHSQLPDSCERYLIHYAVLSLFHLDSSADFENQNLILKDMEKDIVLAFATQTSEVEHIPQLNRFEYF